MVYDILNYRNIGWSMEILSVISKQFINYYCSQKSWWRNLDNICIYYKHMSEENDTYLCHMNKKCRIDRLGGASKIARF